MANVSRILLFLGAGASTPFDFKLAGEVANTFLSSELRVEDSRTLEQIKRSVVQNRFVFDSEALMECLQGGARPYPYVRQAGPFIGSMMKTQPIMRLRQSTTFRGLKESLRRRFEEFLIAQYYKEDIELWKRAKVVYDRLLSRSAGLRAWRNSSPPFHRQVFEIFTTNYDNSLDVYGEQTGETVSRGLRVTGKTVHFFLDELDQPFVRLRIMKLHGSVELSRLANGDIISEVPPSFPGQLAEGHRVVAKVMAYGLSKQLYSEPYLDLLKRLRDVLDAVPVCTVVGYSFRDPWIRRIFEDAASKKRPTDFRLRIVCKSAKRIAKSWHHLERYIDPIPKTIQEYLELPS